MRLKCTRDRRIFCLSGLYKKKFMIVSLGGQVMEQIETVIVIVSLYTNIEMPLTSESTFTLSLPPSNFLHYLLRYAWDSFIYQ